MSRRKRSREHRDHDDDEAMQHVTHEIRYTGLDVRDLGATIHGVRLPGENRFTVFLPHGKVRHIEERGDRDALIDAKYLLRFGRAGDRAEFIDKLGLALEEHQIDDAPAQSRHLNHIGEELFRGHKELSDQLGVIANRLEHMTQLLTATKKKNGTRVDDDGGESTAKKRSTARSKK